MIGTRGDNRREIGAYDRDPASFVNLRIHVRYELMAAGASSRLVAQLAAENPHDHSESPRPIARTRQSTRKNETVVEYDLARADAGGHNKCGR